MKNNNLFWISYSDIMTALFFIMLVLFVVVLAFFRNQSTKAEKKIDEIKSIGRVLKSLDSRYFTFDEKTKRYRMNIDVRFDPNDTNINVVSEETLNELEKAGRNIYNKIDSLVDKNDDIYYLLIIEGNTQRYNRNYIRDPDAGYIKSYERALALHNFWKGRGLDFRDFGESCEFIIAGSGYFGSSRHKNGSYKNRRFTLQITSKLSLNVSDSTSVDDKQ